MRRCISQIGRRALVAAFVLVVAPIGFGCQCQAASPGGTEAGSPAASQTASYGARGGGPTGQLRRPSQPVECPRGVEASVDDPTLRVQMLSAATERARNFVELVEYEPASLGQTTALAILSYPAADDSLGRRSFIYDDALALLWFAWTGQRDKADGLAETLMYLQNPDGSWGFSFDTRDAHNYHASYVRSGTVAWAAHALDYYAARFARPRALRAASRAATFLRRMRLGGDGLERGLVSAGYGTPSTPPDAPPGPTLSYAVSEHQFDAHVVLASHEPRTARRLAERMLEVLWMDEEGRFAVAAAEDRLNTRRALDAAGAWGALWLQSIDESKKAERSYTYALEHFRSGAIDGAAEPDDDQLFGFRPYEDPVDGYDPTESKGHIFVEGTMSMGLAAHRLGDEETAQKVLETGVALSCRGTPGLAYSNVEVPGFSTRPAAASTLWFLFLEREMTNSTMAPLFDSTVLDTTG